MPTDAPSGTKRVSRTVLFVVLGVALVALGFDLNARIRAHNAYNKLQERDAEAVGTTPDDVHKLLNRQPDGTQKEAQGDLQETYTWQGIRKYTVYVSYSRFMGAGNVDTYTMDTVALNQAP